MSYVDVLNDAKKSPTVFFDEFLKSASPNTLHAFVEGKGDVAFYRSFIMQFFNCIDCLFIHECGGKKSVYETRQAIISRNHHPKWFGTMTLLYFVDRDLSEFINDGYEPSEDIFVTDYYSVENYVVSAEMVKIVLMDMFIFPLDSRLSPSEIKEIRKIFAEELERFYQMVAPIMAWGLHHKRKGTRFNFEDIELNKLLQLKPELKVDYASFDYKERDNLCTALDRLCKTCSTDYIYEIERDILDQFKHVEPKKYIRGKFEMWFFHKFMSQLARWLKKTKSSNIKIKENLMSQNDLMISLGPRVPMPTALKDYLQRNIRKRKTRRTRKATSN